MKKKMISLLLAVVALMTLLLVNGNAEAMSSSYLYTADGKIDLLGYFQMEGVTATLEDEAICFTLTAETASISFVRPLTADGFSLRWNGTNDSEKKLETLGMKVYLHYSIDGTGGIIKLSEDE